jgi:hypothetical protein
VFRFYVSKEHSIFRYICHERCVFVIAFKRPRSFFSDRSYKRTLTVNRSTPFSLRRNLQWHDCLRFSLPIVYRSCAKVCRCHHFSSYHVWLLFWTESLRSSRLSVHPNGSVTEIRIKASTIRKDHITVKSKLNTLYRNVKTMYRSVYFV